MKQREAECNKGVRRGPTPGCHVPCPAAPSAHSAALAATPHRPACSPQVADPGSVAPRTLYGVCCYVRELVHRPPSLAKEVGCSLPRGGRAGLRRRPAPHYGGRLCHRLRLWPASSQGARRSCTPSPPTHKPPQAFPGCTAPLRRYLVVAPRCYCLLTHHPFFALHFRVRVVWVWVWVWLCISAPVCAVWCGRIGNACAKSASVIAASTVIVRRCCVAGSPNHSRAGASRAHDQLCR